MSKPNPQPNAQQSSPDSEWREEKVTDALRRLDDLHRKLVGLRSVIPRVIHPLTHTSNYATPQDIFHDFLTRATSCQEQIATFNKLYASSQAVFDHAAASRAAKPDGIERLSPYEMFLPEETASEEPSIVEVKIKQEESADTEMKDAGFNEQEDEDKEPVEPDTLDSEVEGVLQAFREGNPDITIEEITSVTTEGKTRFEITLPPPAAFRFTLEISSIATAGAEELTRRFVITAVRNAKNLDAPPQHLHMSLLRSITVRPNAGSLKLLLDMLASYRNVFTMRCEKCGKLAAGTRVELPVLRRLVKNGDNSKERHWAAFHEVCL